MADGVEDRRAALAAAAEGGRSGLDAYWAGQERIRSSQQAAIDLALDGASNRWVPTEAQNELRGIVDSVGNSAQARVAAAGDRHGTSQGSLSGALGTFTNQSSRVEDLAYQYAKEQAQKALDRSSSGGGSGDMTRSEMEDYARGLGESYRNDALSAETKERSTADWLATLDAIDLEGLNLSIGAVAGIMQADTPEQRAKILEASGVSADAVAANKARRETERQGGEGFLSRVTGNLDRKISPQPPTPAQVAYRQAIDQLAGVDQQRAENQIFLDNLAMGLYDQDFHRRAFTDLGFGDEYMAAGVFNEAPSSAVSRRSALEDVAYFERYGMSKGDYEDSVAEDEQMRLEDLFGEASFASGIPAPVLDKVAESYGLPPEGVAALLTGRGGLAGQAVSEAVAAAMAQISSNPDLDPAQTVLGYIEQLAAENPELADMAPEYAQALRALAVEQVELAIRTTYLGGS